jgi:hypothetical protein
MSNRTDDKRDALLALLVVTEGNTDDLEVTWLKTVVVATAGVQVNDLWRRLFVEQGATLDHTNDMAFEWLGGLGYTGALADRWDAYWTAGGGLV